MESIIEKASKAQALDNFCVIKTNDGCRLYSYAGKLLVEKARDIRVKGNFYMVKTDAGWNVYSRDGKLLFEKAGNIHCVCNKNRRGSEFVFLHRKVSV